MLRNDEIQHIAEYGRAEANASELKIDFTVPFSDIPAVVVSINGNTAEHKKTARLIDVQKGSFTVKLEGIEIADNINWMAVLPGKWETPNGMKLSAGEANNLEEIKISTENYFNSSPAVFHTLLPSGNRKWIVIETNKAEMWSGRFCTAMRMTGSGQKKVEFQLPRYFYDKVLTIAGSQDSLLQPLIEQTTNMGGKIVYQSDQENSSETLHVVSFDGGGGPLYGKSNYKKQ